MRRQRFKIHSTFLFIFGSFFLVMGLFASYIAVGNSPFAYFKAASFDSVPAQIKTLELKKHYGESTTYKVRASYTYRLDGQTYSSSDVALYKSSDNMGSFWQDLYSDLRRAKSRNSAVAFVNPNDPTEALLNRSFRWSMLLVGAIFTSVFGGIGLGIMYYSTKPPRTAPEFNDQARKGIQSDQKAGTRGLLVLAIGLLAIGGMISALVLQQALPAGEYIALLVLVVPILGLLLLRYALIQKKRYQAIGQTLLKMDPVPGAIGGQLGGHFDVGTWRINEDIKISLTCYRTVQRSDETDRTIVWQDHVYGYAKSSGDKTRVRFVFDVTDDLPATRQSIDWKVSCEGVVQIDRQDEQLERSWEVPMEVGQHQSRENKFIPAQFKAAQATKTLEAAQQSAEDQIEVASVGQSFSVISDAGRNLGGTTAVAGIGAIFAVAGYFVQKEVFFFGLIFLVIGIIALVSGVYLMGRKLTAIADPITNSVFVGRSWFGIPLGTKNLVSRSRIEFEKKETSSVSDGGTKTTYFAIYATANDQKLKVAEAIAGKRAADVVIAELASRMGK